MEIIIKELNYIVETNNNNNKITNILKLKSFSRLYLKHNIREYFILYPLVTNNCYYLYFHH